jgi:hypothetical protein
MAKLTTSAVCKLAEKFEGVTVKNHFGSVAYCANGRIFATVWHDKERVNLMLNQEQQKFFLLRDGSEGFIQINNAWGRDAIGVDLASTDADLFTEALKMAWLNSANKRSSSPRKTKCKRTAFKAGMKC